MGFVAIYIQDDLQAGDQQIGGDILETIQRRHAVFNDRRPMIKLLKIRPLERELIETLGKKTANADHGRVLQIGAKAGNGGEFGPKLLNDLVHMLPFGAGTKVHENSALVGADRRATSSNRRHVANDIRVLRSEEHTSELQSPY